MTCFPDRSLIKPNSVWKIADIISSGMVFREQFEPGDPRYLHELERKLIERAVPKRRQEFSAGRACAKEVLAQLGIRDFPLLATADRAPKWPSGIVGSITHTDGYCAAIAARASRFRSVGLDAEVAGKINQAMWPLLFTNVEQTWLDSLPPTLQTLMMTVLFSAKEAFFKYQHPLTHRWFEFTDVVASVGSHRLIKVQTCAANRRWPLSGEGYYGCYRDSDIVVTVIC